MNQYVTIAEYTALGGKHSDLPEADLNLRLKMSSAKIDILTFGRVGCGYLNSRQMEYMKQAVVLQTDHYYELEQSGMTVPGVTGFSVTDVSVSFGGNSAVGSSAWLSENHIKQEVVELLDISGLTWRGV